jgi:hypothetical protein
MRPPYRTVAVIGWCAACGRIVQAGRRLWHTRRGTWVCHRCLP